jgi:predicted tellurium resistance membrane protein TerC
VNEDDQPPHLTRPPAEIKRLSAALDRSRTIALAAMAVLVVTGLALVAVAIGHLGFDPVAVGAIAAAILIGLAFLAWHRHTMRFYANLLRIIETQQAKPDQRGMPPSE